MEFLAFEEITALVARVGRSDIAEFMHEAGGFSIRIKNAVSVDPFADSEASVPRGSDTIVDATPENILSDRVGTFALTHPTQDYPSREEGDAVDEGDIVGLVISGHFVSVIRAPRAGRLGRCLKSVGAVVGFGDPVFEFK